MLDRPTDPFAWRTAPASRGISRSFVIGVLVVGLMLGLTLGLILSTSLGGARTESTVLYDEDLVTSLFKDASPAVVEISVTVRSGGGGPSGAVTGTGSGFLVDEAGHIVTNHHVVDGADEIMVRLFDGRILDAKRLGSSPADDLALLQVDAAEVAGIPPLRLGDSSQIESGEMAIAIGSPFRNFNSVTVGVISGTGRGPASVLRRPIPDMIQTDAPLNPGNSGGPLLNSGGEVVGVTSSVRTETFRGIYEHRIGFAVPSNTVKDLLPELLESQQVRRPWLGISGSTVPRSVAGSPGLQEGIYVTSVFRGSPAEKAGLVPFRTVSGSSLGDVITAVDGQPVGSVEDMVSHFNKLRPGAKVTLSVVYNGDLREVEVTLTEWPDT